MSYIKKNIDYIKLEFYDDNKSKIVSLKNGKRLLYSIIEYFNTNKVSYVYTTIHKYHKYSDKYYTLVLSWIDGDTIVQDSIDFVDNDVECSLCETCSHYDYDWEARDYSIDTEGMYEVIKHTCKITDAEMSEEELKSITQCSTYSERLF